MQVEKFHTSEFRRTFARSFEPLTFDPNPQPSFFGAIAYRGRGQRVGSLGAELVWVSRVLVGALQPSHPSVVRCALAWRRREGEARVHAQALGIHHDGGHPRRGVALHVGLVDGGFGSEVAGACVVEVVVVVGRLAWVHNHSVHGGREGGREKLPPNPRHGVVSFHHGVEWIGVVVVLVGLRVHVSWFYDFSCGFGDWGLAGRGHQHVDLFRNAFPQGEGRDAVVPAGWGDDVLDDAGNRKPVPHGCGAHCGVVLQHGVPRPTKPRHAVGGVAQALTMRRC